jgi:hypothetical protein
MTTVNLTMTRGDTEEFNLTISRFGSLVNLTGAKIWMTAKRAYTGSTVFMKTSEAGEGIVVTDAPNGAAKVTLAVADTEVLPAETFELIYDVQVKTAAGLVFTPIDGTLTVKPDATTVTA